MMVFKKAVPRRTFLRGLGATIALPLLDGMVPAFAAVRKTAARAIPRLSFVYAPNGAIMDKWTPAAVGSGYELTPILQQLAPFRDRFLVLTGLNGGPAEVGGHPRASAMWLTGVDPKKSAYDLRAGVSVDQIAAKVLGKETPVPSLELGIEAASELVGEVSGGYSSAYTNTVCWSTPTTPLPMEHKPRVVFERLFGDGASTGAAERLARIQEDRSVLDFVSQDVSRLMRSLGAGDRTKLAQYLDAIRDIERRIHVAEARSAQELPLVTRPVGLPDYEDHVRMMFDLQVIAFQTDLTRVSTFMIAREKSDFVYTMLGQTEPHHALSHNRGIASRIAQKLEIDLYLATLFSYYLEKLQATPDGDGTLLDHAMVVYGSGLSDGDGHSQQDLPTLLVGGGAGRLRGGRHLKYPTGTPISNLHLALLDFAGVPAANHGDSTGPLELMS
jgi:hypothetical protein